MGRDRRTNESRGFAFINYANRDDAQKVCYFIILALGEIYYFQAIDAMNGYGYDHLILSVEWSENRKKDAESTDKPSGYQSRVRKH